MSNQVLEKSKLTFSSTTEKDLRAGNIAFDETGAKYVKCKAATAIAANTALILTAVTTERGYTVYTVDDTGVIADTHKFVGVNNTGGTIASGAFFWAKRSGELSALAGTTGAIAVGAVIYLSATAGEVDDAVGTAASILGVCTVASSGAGTVAKFLSVLG